MPSGIPAALDSAQMQARLTACETIIGRGLKSFLEVGNALLEIRDERLYLLRHGTFEDYCESRWQIGRSRAYQLMTAAEAVSTIVDKDASLPAVSNEAQARELAAAPDDERAEVWREANERTDGKPTAATVRQIREERAAASPVPTVALAPVPAVAASTAVPDMSAPDPRPAVAEALDRFVGPDPDAAARDLEDRLMAALNACRPLARFDADEVARLAGDDVVKQLTVDIDGLVAFVGRVKAARAALNLRHLRAV